MIKIKEIEVKKLQPFKIFGYSSGFNYILFSEFLNFNKNFIVGNLVYDGPKLTRFPTTIKTDVGFHFFDVQNFEKTEHPSLYKVNELVYNTASFKKEYVQNVVYYYNAEKNAVCHLYDTTGSLLMLEKSLQHPLDPLQLWLKINNEE